MPLDLKELKASAKEYVEVQARVKVLSVRFARRFRLFGEEEVVLEAITDDRKDRVWWVVGGTRPMNLYSQRQYPDIDAVFALHIGVIARVLDKEFRTSTKAPLSIGYDAFISHAGEDKNRVARPLAKALVRRGYRIWFDEFELRAGQSLRESIDRGLANSKRGIVVLSRAFFSKKWPELELNGLVSRESKGKKLLLPIWHGVDERRVRRFSPILADRVAYSSPPLSIGSLADKLSIDLDLAHR